MNTEGSEESANNSLNGFAGSIALVQIYRHRLTVREFNPSFYLELRSRISCSIDMSYLMAGRHAKIFIEHPIKSPNAHLNHLHFEVRTMTFRLWKLAKFPPMIRNLLTQFDLVDFSRICRRRKLTKNKNAGFMVPNKFAIAESAWGCKLEF